MYAVGHRWLTKASRYDPHAFYSSAMSLRVGLCVVDLSSKVRIYPGPNSLATRSLQPIEINWNLNTRSDIHCNCANPRLPKGSGVLVYLNEIWSMELGCLNAGKLSAMEAGFLRAGIGV